MKRREFLKVMGVGIVPGIMSCSIGRGAAAAKGKQPNLLIVFPDQMRAFALGFMHEDPVRTPVLDAFAQQSLVLTQAVSNYPVCSPFRAMLMTGKWPVANHVWNNCTNKTEPYGCELQKSDRCFSDVLKDQGYSCGYIGKWHLESPRPPYIDCANNRGDTKWNEWCPPDRRHGFDYWYSYNTYDNHLRPMYWSTDAGRQGFHYVDQWGPEHEADMTIRYIRNEGGKVRDADKPFALVVSMNPPHTPYNAVPEKYKKLYANMTDAELIKRKDVLPGSSGWKVAHNSLRNYFAMCTGVDEQFGRILKVLAEEGIENDTLVLFTSDHGNCLGSHNVPTKNVHWEESMRIPFIVRFPGRIPARKDDLLISVPDIYPTLLDLLGLGRYIPRQVQGHSYAGYFRTGQGAKPDAQLYIYAHPGDPSLGRRGIRTARYTFVIERKDKKTEKVLLFDNVKDRYQMHDIAASEPEIEKKLRGELHAMLKDLRDPWVRS